MADQAQAAAHWDTAYAQGDDIRSWYEKHPDMSLRMLASAGLSAADARSSTCAPSTRPPPPAPSPSSAASHRTGRRTAQACQWLATARLSSPASSAPSRIPVVPSGEQARHRHTRHREPGSLLATRQRQPSRSPSTIESWPYARTVSLSLPHGPLALAYNLNLPADPHHAPADHPALPARTSCGDRASASSDSAARPVTTPPSGRCDGAACGPASARGSW